MKNQERAINSDTQIIVTGSIAEDLIKVIPQSFIEFLTKSFSPHHPNLSVSFLVSRMSRERGGTGANIAYSLGLLKAEPVLLGSLGKSDTAYAEHLASQGVNIDHLHWSDLDTASFTVLTDQDNNQFAGFYPGAMTDPAIRETLSLKPWAGSDAYVVIAPHDPEMMLQQIHECVEGNLPFMFDIGQQTDNSELELIETGIKYAHMLIANENEMHRLAQRLDQDPEEMKDVLPIAITTLGKKGVYLQGQLVGERQRIPAVKVENVVDPTGAGDAYRAGLLAALKLGIGIEDACRVGAIVAAEAIQYAGGQKHQLDLEQVLAQLDEINSDFPAKS